MIKKNIFNSFCLLILFGSFISFSAQITIPSSVLQTIVRAEDELRFDRDLIDLLKSSVAKIRVRAALAAGRIGSENAISPLSELLDKDADADVRAMAAFALGEIESVKAADAILETLAKKDETDSVRARALEAAGKIAAANPKNEKSGELGEAILDALEAQQSSASRNREVILLGLTAALRAKPEESDFVVSKFLTDKDASIRADALNTLVRLRSKNEKLKAQYRAMLLSDDDAIVRANAARALGASEDALSLDLLIEAATTDDDQRVRVAAIRSIGSLKDKKAATPLLERGEKLYRNISTATQPSNEPTPNFKQYGHFYPSEQNELLEIFTTLGRILINTNNERALKLLHNFMSLDGLESPEPAIAAARISPRFFSDTKISFLSRSEWKEQISLKQAFGEAANLEKSKNNDELRNERVDAIRRLIKGYATSKEDLTKAIPDSLRAFDAFKTNDLPEVLHQQLKAKDIIVRATVAELLGEQTANKENVEALKTAFVQALQNDKQINDAQLAILSALVKLNKTEAIDSLKLALDAPDFLVRRHAATLIKQNDLTKNFPNVDVKIGTVKPFSPASKTKLGQILNSNADYVRAISRRNGFTKAILTTEKGAFTIDLMPEDAPLTVDNFVKLAKSGYFNGISFHRVVPNFVVQGGDPRGDGNGGPGWQIRCEINMISFERGAVGMALSGKDTGGSQWFVTHSPQPHLDGGYTVFGRVNETDMKIVDTIARGDKILSVKIVENVLRRGAETQRKRK